MVPRRTVSAERPPVPIYSETLDKHLFALYDDGTAYQLRVDGKLERTYLYGFEIFRRILEDIETDWEVEPSRELWPGV